MTKEEFTEKLLALEKEAQNGGLDEDDVVGIYEDRIEGLEDS